jgi:hypothetical protein
VLWFTADVVEVFGYWDALQHADKRALLREYGVEIVARIAGDRKHGKRRLEVERIRFDGLPARPWLYKKMKRLGIEWSSGTRTGTPAQA